MLRRLALTLLLLVGCDDGAGVDAGAMDAGPSVDASAVDAGGMDAGALHDAGGLDSGGFSEAGMDFLGLIGGQCGVLDMPELTGGPLYVEGSIEFPTAPTMDDLDLLSSGAREIIAEGNLGGSSLYSEAISFEVLARCEMAILVKTEAEIEYQDPMGARTDYLAQIDGFPVGVSVTRAVGFPREDPYPVMAAEMLLTDKLMGIQQSTANVSASDGWVKQILHVLAYEPMHAMSIMAAWNNLDPSLQEDTILLVTVTNGEDAFIYDDML